MSAGRMGEPTDEGFDDYPLHMYSPQQPKRAIATPAGYQLPIKVTDIQLMESLARTLKISVSSEACAHLAVLLLSHAPADMLKMTMQRLDLLLRRDFIGMLPLEISTRILEYVPIIDIVKNASFVSRQWYAATTQPCLWHRLFRRQGWGIDKERWALYYSLPCSLSPGRILLDSAILQVSQALIPAAAAENEGCSPAPATASRSSMAAIRQHVLSDESPIQAALMLDASGLLQPPAINLSTATAQAMALGLARQSPRKPRRILNTLLLDSLRQKTAIGKISASVPVDNFTFPEHNSAATAASMLSKLGAAPTTVLVADNDYGSGSSDYWPNSGFQAAKQQSFRQHQHQQQHRWQNSSDASFMLPASLPQSKSPFSAVSLSSPKSKSSSPMLHSLSPRQQSLSPSLYNQNSNANENGKQKHTQVASKQPVDWRKLYSEYHRLLVNWRDGKCRVDRWESAHAESVYCLQFDQNNRLFTGSRDRTVKLWHLSETGSQIVPLATLKGHSGSVLTLQADDNTLITGSSDGTMCIWSMDTYTIVHRLVHPDSVLSLRFNDKWLATACKDRVVRVWRRDQGYKDVFELLGHAVAINAIHLYEDTLVSASGDRTIKIWDLKTRTCVQTLADHTRGVACLDFDGTYIVSGSSDRSIRIWDAVTGACQRVIHNAHTDLVRTVMFNRKQDILVSGSYDESIKIWSLSTGALMHKIKNVHTSRVFKLMFDRSRIISCSHDRSVSIIDFAAELEHARLLL